MIPFVASRSWAASRTLAMICAAVVSTGCGGTAPKHPAIGRAMGTLPIESLAEPAAETPTLSGKVTLLNFWGTWCPPCRRELPGLVRIAKRLADEPRFQLVAVSCGPGFDDFDELAAETRNFLERQRLDLDAWAFGDPISREKLASVVGLEAFPSTYLIGPDATVRRVWVGYRTRDEAEIAAAIVEALKELPATAPAAAG